ncbi:hypothetical protein X732_11915 [Mesorhizobium sp. L2C066B000]|nr:hypothetical protein X732_11915 [Mesorhizobium sp. L2C066B000]
MRDSENFLNINFANIEEMYHIIDINLYFDLPVI